MANFGTFCQERLRVRGVQGSPEGLLCLGFGGKGSVRLGYPSCWVSGGLCCWLAGNRGLPQGSAALLEHWPFPSDSTAAGSDHAEAQGLQRALSWWPNSRARRGPGCKALAEEQITLDFSRHGK